MAANTNIKDLLDSLVDDEGLRTEVTVTLTDTTLMKTSLTLMGTVIISSVSFFLIKGLFRSGQK